MASLDVVRRPRQDGVEIIIVDRDRSLTMPYSRSGRLGLCAGVLTILAAHAAVASAAESREFKVGFAEQDISPSIGMEQPGGYGKAYHRTFHDPCKVRAAVLDDGKTRVAIVGIDALFIRRQTVQTVRDAISKKCGIKPESILISASHTHSGGPTGYYLPGEFDDASPLVRSLVHERTVCANPDYLAKVERGIVDAVCVADARRTPARCGVALGSEDKVAFNRRFRMKDGFTMTHPGQGNPGIIEPAGPTDPEVGVLGAWSAEGKFLGCIVNFACHATTGPGGISADYVYYIEKTIRGLMGGQAVVVFLPGAAGDVTQVDNRSPYQIKQFGEVSARFVGGRVGAEALKALLAMEQGTGPLLPLTAETRVLNIKRRRPSPEHVAQALKIVEKDPKAADATEWVFAKETVVLDARMAREPVAPVEVQAVQVGPAVFLACPAEYFCQFGLDMKARSKFPFTFPVSLANDAIGYVPTEEALGLRGGGYETRLTSYSNLEPAAGRQIAEALIDLSATLKPGPLPNPPALPPFRAKPWSYGNLPAQVD
jgi:neutral ceramidase